MVKGDSISYVWIRTDLVDAWLENDGQLPRNWKPGRKRGRPGEQVPSYTWCKGNVIQQVTPKKEAASSPFGSVKLRRVSAGSSNNTIPSSNSGSTNNNNDISNSILGPIHLQLDDDDLIDYRGIELSFEKVPENCIFTANTWWQFGEDAPSDLTQLAHLHEPSVLYCLNQRYQQELIYTYTGKILLALNPFRYLPALYGEDLMDLYALTSDTPLASKPPHIYATAQDTFSRMVQFNKNQSILVSGESGAGKTVTTKIILSYLTTICSSAGQSMEQQLLQSNPILESFGNARTVRNDNSSRFGKFIQIQFSGTAIVSASIQTYLLEKVRLITQSAEERNYHIFYELLSGGLTTRERRQLGILNLTPRDFRITAMGSQGRRDGVRDNDTFGELREAMDTCGFLPEEQQYLFLVCCAVLHCSNIELRASSDGSACEMSGEAAAVHLMGIEEEQFRGAILHSAVEARGEVFMKQLTREQAQKAIEALMKATYATMFDYIVERINDSITVVDTSTARTTSIGVLDIFGFESFETNSFEQLCINFCNEALQQQFNRYVFKAEQKDYEREGIDWSFIEFPDNQDVLDLIEKKHAGILAILDEQCMLGRCTDQTFARALYEKCHSHGRFSASSPQKINSQFSIQHYAGMVEYDASTSFLEKNKDELPKETVELLESSSNEFIASLGAQLAHKVAGGAQPRMKSSLKKESVGSQFLSQLRSLRDVIDQTTPHYVRCLKPNDELVPDSFDSMIIADQLRCAGVLEAIRVSRVGFPQRYFHDEFCNRYKLLVAVPAGANKRRQSHVRKNDRQHDCEVVIQALSEMVAQFNHNAKQRDAPTTPSRISPSRRGIGKSGKGGKTGVDVGIQMGKTKVFLRQFAFDKLELLRSGKIQESAVVIQAYARRMVARIDYEISLFAITIIQSFCRRLNAMKFTRTIRRERSAILVQKTWRRFAAESRYLACHCIARWMQRHHRGSVARVIYAYLSLDKKIIKIQSVWRRFSAEMHFWSVTRIALLTQAIYRGYAARQELKRLKMEARSLVTVARERDSLKNEVRELRKQIEQNAASKQPMDTVSESHSEITFLKDEVRRLQDQIAVHAANDLDMKSFADESAAKDVEIAELRQQLAALKSPVKARGRASSKRISLPIASPSLLSPLARFLGGSPKEAERKSQRSEPPCAEIRTDPSGMSVTGMSVMTSTSLLDNEEEEEGENNSTGAMTISPVSRHLMMSSSTVSEHQNYNMVETGGEDSSSADDAFLLHKAIRQGDEDEANRILVESNFREIIVNETDFAGKSPLHNAVEAGKAVTVERLLKCGAAANAQDFGGNTPLHLATDPSIVSLLLVKGKANPNIPNMDGICALHNATERLDVVSVQHILRHNANVNVADNIDWLTPLHLLLQRHRKKTCGSIDDLKRARPRIVSLLCSAPIELDSNAGDKDGNTPLHYAVTLELEDVNDILKILLNKGSKPNVVNSRGQTPLHLLCHNNRVRDLEIMQEMLNCMLYHGANPNLISTSGCTGLHLSLYHRDVDSAVLLVSHGADLHLPWTMPGRWKTFWKETDSATVLALDMLEDEQSLSRVLAAISKPQTKAPKRSQCMNCRSNLGTFSRAMHCCHCGRYVCNSCCQRSLEPHYFPKSFEVYETSWVCIVCERILLAGKTDDMSATQPTTSFLSDDEEPSLSRVLPEF